MYILMPIISILQTLHLYFFCTSYTYSSIFTNNIDFIALHSHKLRTCLPSELHLQSMQDPSPSQPQSSQSPFTQQNSRKSSFPLPLPEQSTTLLSSSRSVPCTTTSSSTTTVSDSNGMHQPSHPLNEPPLEKTSSGSKDSPYGNFPMPPMHLPTRSQTGRQDIHSDSESTLQYYSLTDKVSV